MMKLVSFALIFLIVPPTLADNNVTRTKGCCPDGDCSFLYKEGMIRFCQMINITIDDAFAIKISDCFKPLVCCYFQDGYCEGSCPEANKNCLKKCADPLCPLLIEMDVPNASIKSAYGNCDLFYSLLHLIMRYGECRYGNIKDDSVACKDFIEKLKLLSVQLNCIEISDEDAMFISKLLANFFCCVLKNYCRYCCSCYNRYSYSSC